MHELLELHGAASAGQLRGMRNRLPRLLAAGVLRAPYPGVYVVSEREAEPRVRLLAAQLSLPHGVLLGRAARAAMDPQVRFDVVDVAVARFSKPRPGVVQHRLVVKEVTELRGLRLPDPAWNAVWSAAWDDGEGIDHFLRRGGSIHRVREALTEFRGTTGVDRRRALVAETKAASWSTGERVLHRLLRQHRIEGWEANAAILTSVSNLRLVVDVVFRAARLAVEFDGWEFHRSREAFESDRARQAELVADGWRVLRFTWWQVQERPDWVVQCIRECLASSARRAA